VETKIEIRKFFALVGYTHAHTCECGMGVKLGRVVGGLLGVATLGGNIVNGKVRLSEERTGLVCGLHWRFYVLFWFFLDWLV